MMPVMAQISLIVTRSPCKYLGAENVDTTESDPSLGTNREKSI